MIQKISALFTALDGIASELAVVPLPADVPTTRFRDFANEFTQFVAKYSIVEFLESRVNGLIPSLVMAGVVDQFRVFPSAGETNVGAYVRKELHFERLFGLLSSPPTHFRALLGWGATDFSFQVGAPLFARVEEVLRQVGFAPFRLKPADVFTLDAGKLSLTASPTNPLAVLGTLGVRVPSGISFNLNLKPGVDVSVSAEGEWPLGTNVEIVPPGTLRVLPASGEFSSRLAAEIVITPTTSPTFRLVGVAGGSRLEVADVRLGMGVDILWDGSAGTGEPFASATLEGGRAFVDLSLADGFLKSLTGAKSIEADFEIGGSFGPSLGLRFDGGGLEFALPIHLSFAGIRIDSLKIGFPVGQSGVGFPVQFTASIGATFGPFNLVVDQVGLATSIDFSSTTGALGVADLQARLAVPTGIGLSLDGPGGVTGGGFLAFDEGLGRYSGSIELQVFGIGVKAFGLLETKFPDGRDGFSFVVVISAEFTPIQIGFGFTLNGVGGLLGLNRSLVVEALGDAVRQGSLEHLLFPNDPVRDAPAILNDLETIYPATPDHQVIGPMAKLGWGTPTLITADLGVVVELPGPRIAVVGVAQTALPTKAISLVKLNLAIAGVLDFPKRLFSIDASLYDSRVGTFGVTGDAAFRMSFGDEPNFVFSIGGFNPTFKAPPNFPKLRRASVDLGVNGNPSLTLSGYFALTSNTAQIGAAIRLYANGAGIELEGHVSFDALFVFSPFSFDADLDAGMSVSFHGVGIGIHFHGHLSGPSPYNVSGDVCVSILFWDACLGVSATFGEAKRATLPTIDPWDVVDAPELIGLKGAVGDARNWSGSPPPSTLSVVSLAETATDTPPIDPLGSATLRQKIVPLNQKLTRFGAFKPKQHDKFTDVSVSIGTASTAIPITDIKPVTDKFARESFKELSGAERLSAPPYDDMEAGFTLDPEVLRVGPVKPKQIEFQTELINGDTEVTAANYLLTERHLRAMLLKSAAGLAGVRRTGLLKYVDPKGPLKVRLKPERFAVADACSRARNLDVTPSSTTHIQASLALEDHVLGHPEDAGRFAVVPAYELGL